MAADAVRWGLLGTGRMAARFAEGLKAAGSGLAAVAARDEARARAFAAAAGSPRYHASYQALLDDPSVDIVHLSLPNALHAEWSVRALEAGKHVLCEKPGALDGAEAARVDAAARRSRRLWMEGFMHRLHPQWDLALSLVASGRIGAVRRLESAFAYDMGDKPLENRLSRDRAGGALLDVGCYCLHFSRLMAGAASGADPGEGPVEPIGAEASSDFGPSGVDLATRATLLFPGGIEADFACALRGPARKLAVVHGEEGRIEIAEPWHPAADGAEIRVVPAGGDAEIWKAGDGLALFAREALAAAEASARGECPALTRRGSVGQARALEALRRSAGHI